MYVLWVNKNLEKILKYLYFKTIHIRRGVLQQPPSLPPPDSWQMTYDSRQMTDDVWQMTYDSWQMTDDVIHSPRWRTDERGIKLWVLDLWICPMMTDDVWAGKLTPRLKYQILRSNRASMDNNTLCLYVYIHISNIPRAGPRPPNVIFPAQTSSDIIE